MILTFKDDTKSSGTNNYSAPLLTQGLTFHLRNML